MNSEASGGIPFMITAIQKQGLRDRGYSDDAIRSLTPEQAHAILITRYRAEAERFLKALDPDTDRFTFQVFDDDKERKRARGRDKFARVLHGTLAEHWPTLVKLNKQRAGIYVTINATDFKGRRAKNIVRVRAVFVDLDGSPLEPVSAAALPPHIVTETSAGRFHAYWRLVDMPLDEFTPLQKALIARFRSDNIHDLPRVLRLPGFIHGKGEPFLSRILQINQIGPYRWKDLRETFLPPANNKPQQRREEQSHDHDDLSDRWHKLQDEAIRRYSDWVPDVLPNARKIDKGYRVSSADLGRDLEEDLSFHEDGIKDFGLHDMGDPRSGSRTPIDIVMEYLPTTDFNVAVRWLAQKLGHDPQDYLPNRKLKTNGHGSGDAATDSEVARLANLSTVRYERERVDAAKKLGLRSATLDKLVIDERTKQAYAKKLPWKSAREQAAKTEAGRLLTELNADNCIVLDGARTRVLRFEGIEHDAGGEHYVYRVPTFLRFEDFRNLYLNRRIVVDDRSRDVGNWWLHHPERRQYDGIIFKPAGEPIINGKLNLWRGWGVTPRRGECSFLFGDECYAPDDRGAEGQLKRLITEPTLQIEPKGRDPIEEPNRLHVVLASNADWWSPAAPTSAASWCRRSPTPIGKT
jgi:Family of unknown function (DUF5906)/RepB DNA-primase N-terminal domain